MKSLSLQYHQDDVLGTQSFYFTDEFQMLKKTHNLPYVLHAMFV